MSGGHFGYSTHNAAEIADEIQRVIDTNDSDEVNEYGDRIGHGYPPEIIAKFKEAVRIGRLATAMHQRVDWLVSGDDGPESFLRRWDEEIAKLDAGDVSAGKEIKQLRIALADAIRRPMGVIPDSAIGLLSPAELDAAEQRRIS